MAGSGFYAAFLCHFLNLVIPDARCARAQAFMRTVHKCAHRLQIHVPAAIGHIVSMAYFMPKLRSLAANFTNSCHLMETPGFLSGPLQMREGAKTYVNTGTAQTVAN
jgi:hypothetical protein